MLIQMSLCCLNPFQVEWRLFGLPRVFLLEEQLVGITTSNYTVKCYKVSGTSECVVLRHFRITAEKWPHLQAISQHMWIICSLQMIHSTCESSAGYRFLKSLLWLDIIATSKSIILLVCFIGSESSGLEITPCSLCK